jgi:hypothetical protein
VVANRAQANQALVRQAPAGTTAVANRVLVRQALALAARRVRRGVLRAVRAEAWVKAESQVSMEYSAARSRADHQQDAACRMVSRFAQMRGLAETQPPSSSAATAPKTAVAGCVVETMPLVPFATVRPTRAARQSFPCATAIKIARVMRLLCTAAPARDSTRTATRPAVRRSGAVRPPCYHFGVFCSCPADALCDECVAKCLSWWSSVASCRGLSWAERLAKHTPPPLPAWPETDKMRRAAAHQLADLTRDPRVLAALVPLVIDAARKRWGEL